MKIKKLANKLRADRSSREARQSLFRRRPLFEALERRYLMSAELVPPPLPESGEQVPFMPDDPYPGQNNGVQHGRKDAHPDSIGHAAFDKPATLGEQVTLDQYAKASAARQGNAKAGLPDQEAGEQATLDQDGKANAAGQGDAKAGLPDQETGEQAALDQDGKANATRQGDAKVGLLGQEAGEQATLEQDGKVNAAHLGDAKAWLPDREAGEQVRLDQDGKANAARLGDAKAWLSDQEAGQRAKNGPRWVSPPGYTTQSEQTQITQIIFIDPAIDNAEQLTQGLYSLVSGKTENLGGLATPTGDGPQVQVIRSHDTEIIVLDDRYDGVEQITQILAQHSDLNAVQIMSHGSVGELTLGTATLGQISLGTYQDQLRAWGDALAPDGDILLYGCNVAAGSSGNSFVDSLSDITRADVAAATHTIGSAELGGDWVLDYRDGTIEATTLTVAAWNGVLADTTGAKTGGSTLVGVAAESTLVAYGSDNTFVFDDNSAASTTITLYQGMKQDANGVWITNKDDENINNTLDFSAVTGDVIVTVTGEAGNSGYQVSYFTAAGAQHTIAIEFKSSNGDAIKIGDKTFNLIGTALGGKTILDYSGYATGVTVDLSGPSEDSNGDPVPPAPLTAFGYVRAVTGVIGSNHGNNTISVVGGTTVTVQGGDTIKGSGGDNTYIIATTGAFALSQQGGQSGNTLDLSLLDRDITARVLTQGGVTVYLSAGVDATGTIKDHSGETAWISNLDIQILIGVEGRTTLDYSSYEDNVTVNLNYQDDTMLLSAANGKSDLGIYDASGLQGVTSISNVIGTSIGDYGNDIVGSLGDNIITVSGSHGANRISGGGGTDVVYGSVATGGTTEYIAGVESNATLSGTTTQATLTDVAGTTNVTMYNVNAVTLQDFRTIHTDLNNPLYDA
ncbi:MAG: DUF4347 domain-containing protein, partial [Desulfobulbus sp.]|nr:DUF4347 domain-containing protein [Desulfobulbus sp.]